MLIRDRRPAYISREWFEANQARLEANRARHDRPARRDRGRRCWRGSSDADGVGGGWWCGTLELRIDIVYTCTRGSYDYAEPLCQSLSGSGGRRTESPREILKAVEPAAFEASLAAIAEVERERAELSRHWQLRRERARQEVERAARQYHVCEPENRLVARELERRWEESLRSQRQLEEDYERWQRTALEPTRQPMTNVRSALLRPTCRRCGTRQRPRPPKATNCAAAPGARGRHRGQDERTSRPGAALGRRSDAVPHAGSSREAVRPAIRLSAVGGAAAGAVPSGSAPRRSPSGSTRRASDRRNGWTGSRPR